MSLEGWICILACPLGALWLMVAPPLVSYALNKRKDRMRNLIADDAQQIAAEHFPSAEQEIAAAVLTMIWSATGIRLKKMKPESRLGVDLALTDFDGMDFEQELEERYGVRLPGIGRHDTLEQMISYVCIHAKQ